MTLTLSEDRLRRSENFNTLRLTCRPVAPPDRAFYAGLFGLPETVAHRPDPRPMEPTVAERQLELDIAHWREHGFGRWMLSHAGEDIGLGGLTIRPGHDGLNLSYHLMPEMWGQGLASEFVRAAIDFARDDLGATRLFGLVRPSNIASVRVLEKAGFRDAGMHRVHGGPMRELRLEL